MEIQRFRWAMARPAEAQKALSSTSQRSSVRELIGNCLRSAGEGAAR